MSLSESQKIICDILDSLASESYTDILWGIARLGSFLKLYITSVREYRRSGKADTKLALFRSLQENFQYNLAIGLCSAYTFFAKHPKKVEDSVLVLLNDLLTGILLIHPESRALFGRGQNMSLILSFLDPNISSCSKAVCVSFLSLLIHILLKNTKNLRMFETNGGCRILIHHLHVDTTRYSESGLDMIHDVSASEKLLLFKVIEFLLFYLTDESDLVYLPHNLNIPTLTVEEKAKLFRPSYPGIDDLIESLKDLNSTYIYT